MNCGICNIELPAASSGPWCDEHQDGHALPVPDRPPQPKPAHVVHNGAICKLNGGLECMESGVW